MGSFVVAAPPPPPIGSFVGTPPPPPIGSFVGAPPPAPPAPAPSPLGSTPREGILDTRDTFKLEPNDVILATFPKSGTTWFTALLFTIMTRAVYTDFSSHPLLEKSPHECSRWIHSWGKNDVSDNADMWSPVVKAHFQYTSLPKFVTNSKNPIIYVYRNPADVFVSMFYYSNKIKIHRGNPTLELNEAFEMYCKGGGPYGSYWDHVLGYWNASKETSNKLLLLRYEDMQTQPINILKKLAEFVGYPFTKQEEQVGLIDKIVGLCSFESLTSFRVNQDAPKSTNSVYFRKGKVGDYVNHLTDKMIQRLEEIMSIKFKDSRFQVFDQKPGYCPISPKTDC